MPLFICRWQNGDFSAVSAATKTDAIALRQAAKVEWILVELIESNE